MHAQCMGKAVKAAVVASGVNATDIVAMTVDTTCCTVVALDVEGNALRPALLWMDMRSANQAARVAASGDAALIVNGAGAGPVSAEWMIPKAMWIKDNEPTTYKKARYICEYQDYINFHLTKRMCACTNNISVRWHYDTQRDGGWPVNLLEKLAMEDLLEKWPMDVVAPGAVVGSLTSDAASHLGLHERVIVAQGGADAFIGMIGLGVVSPGDMALITGSSHLHLGCTNNHIHGNGIWGTYNDAVLPGVNIIEGGQTSTGSVLAWFRRLVSDPSWQQLDAEADAIPVGSEGLICLDHFQGNRTPHTDPLSRGAITGLTLKHGRGHIFRSLIESICFGTEAVLEAMRANGYCPSQIVVAGGPTRSKLWLQCHADICGLPFVLTQSHDAPLLGCAILAATCAGLYPNIQAAIEQMVKVVRVVHPDPMRNQAYKSFFSSYKQLYSALKRCSHYRSDDLFSGDASTSWVSSDGETQKASVIERPLKPIVSPSILSADFAALAADVIQVAKAGAEWIHVDVFDGNFVPNLTIGPPVIKSLRKHTDAFLDCHLCVLNPQNYLNDLAAAGASQMTFHIETEGINMDCNRAAALAIEIHKKGMMAGIALAPETNVETIFPLLNKAVIDTVLLLSVRPGFGGQKFMPSVLPKVRTLRQKYPKLNIEVDGGINLENAQMVASAGANALVAGTTVFAGPKPSDEMVPELVGLISAGLEEAGIPFNKS